MVARPSFRGHRKTVAFEFTGAPGVGINLLASVRQKLNREFFEAFPEPVEPRGGANIFKREYQVQAGLSAGRCGRSGLRLESRRSEKDKAAKNGDETRV